MGEINVKDDIKYMIIKVIMYDCILGVIILLIASVFARLYILPLILGLIVASVNFMIGGALTRHVLLKGKSSFLLIFFNSIKIIVICGIGIILFKYNKYNVIAYIYYI